MTEQIVDHIERNKQRLSESPLMAFLQDHTIDPRRRLGFAPCMAPFVMGFADINRYGLRDDRSEDPIQGFINAHSRQDDHHWGMYLRDLRTLGENVETDLVGALRSLWGKERIQTRRTVYELMSMIDGTAPAVRMAIVEAIEATAVVATSRFTPLAREFAAATGQTLYFFGALHESLENGHALGTDDAARQLAASELTPAEEREALGLVDRIFALFHGMFDEWMDYARRVGPRPRSGREAAARPVVRA
jgi:hypothetical protein